MVGKCLLQQSWKPPRTFREHLPPGLWGIPQGARCKRAMWPSLTLYLPPRGSIRFLYGCKQPKENALYARRVPILASEHGGGRGALALYLCMKMRSAGTSCPRGWGEASEIPTLCFTSLPAQPPTPACQLIRPSRDFSLRPEKRKEASYTIATSQGHCPLPRLLPWSFTLAS